MIGFFVKCLSKSKRQTQSQELPRVTFPEDNDEELLDPSAETENNHTSFPPYNIGGSYTSSYPESLLPNMDEN